MVFFVACEEACITFRRKPDSEKASRNSIT